MKTTFLTTEQARESRSWHLVDASQFRLGRMATALAEILMGKHRPEYTPHVDSGDYVVVINAEKVQMTGDKRENKSYDHYTGYMSGLRTVKIGASDHTSFANAIRLAVKRMLPKTTLGKQMLTKLKVYEGSEHPHAAQQPQPIELRVRGSK